MTMAIRFSTLAAATCLLATPVLADCKDDIAAMEETWAGSGEMPATQHQQEVLSDAKEDGDTADPAAAPAADADPAAAATTHQEEVIEGAPSTGEAHALLAEAAAMAEAGNEQGCMEKLQQAQQLSGQN
jgi:hypothetical protein